MKLITILSGLLLVCNSTIATTPNNKIKFIENKGQVSDQYSHPRADVLFSGLAGPMAFHLKKTGISYQLSKTLSWKEIDTHQSQLLTKSKASDKISIYRIDVDWLNINDNVFIEKGNALDGYNNYYNEVCPNGATNVRSYSDIMYKNIYNGIDLHYYNKEGQLKYDYLVKANSDYKQIQLGIEGAEKIELNKTGELIITTPLGKIIEGTPLVYQNGKQLESKWILNNNIISFEIKNYNPSLSLVIDPLTRAWGTYYGGTGLEEGYSNVTDATGNVYMAGFTDSNSGTVIATIGSHQTILGGSSDAFFVKFNSSGVRQWGTYYGGTGDDRAYGCAIDASGNLFIAGYSNSGTGSVIATAGAHQTTYGGITDAFLAKFNSSGIRQWGTYYGGTSADQGWQCATDVSGNVYLTGHTDSNNGIATASSHQSTFSGGSTDGFIVKFNSGGVRQWGTYYGGMGLDHAYGCVTDGTTSVYFVGKTDTNTGTAIATPGSHQPTLGAGPSQDGFLVKFNSSGVRQWATYYGGNSPDEAFYCAKNATGDIYIVGYAMSNTGTEIATIGSYQPSNAGVLDAFVAKFNSSGVRQWGTYYGGPGNELGYGCTVDASGNVIMSGFTSSTVGLGTVGSYQPNYGGGTADGFIVQFNSAGVIQWGTYYGDAGTDYMRGCSFDAAGNMFIAGISDTNTGTIIATAGSHQSTNGGGTSDAFLVKFNALGSGFSELNTNNNYEVYVYPNPTSHDFTISLNQLTENTTIEIYNAIGQLVKQQTLTELTTKLSLEKEPNGVYFVRLLEGKNSVHYTKIIKQ